MLIFVVYSVGLAYEIGEVVAFMARTVMRPATSTQSIGTELVQLPDFWDMELAQLRVEAGQRGLFDTGRMTKRFLARWLIENDFPRVRVL